MPNRVYTVQQLFASLNNSGVGTIQQPSQIPVALFDISEEVLVSEVWRLVPSTAFITYAGLIISDAGPLGLWELQDPTSSTTAFDSNPYGPKNMGTVHGTVTWQQSATEIANSKSALFNGTSGYISTAYIPSALTEFSLEGWANVTLPGSGTAQPRIISTGFFSTGGGGFELGFFNTTTTSEAFGTVYPGGSSAGVTVQSGSISAAAWHHLVATYDGTSIRLYVDGSLAAGPTAAGFSQAVNPIEVGAQSGANFMNGKLQEVAFYPVALTATQVANHYTWGTTGSGPNSSYTYGGTIYPIPPV